MISQYEQEKLNDNLFKASKNGELEKVKDLIKSGAEVDARDAENWNSLHWASSFGHLEVVKYLIEKGADVDETDTWGWTPLHSASRDGHLEVVKYLVEKGADVDARDKWEKTPLHKATYDGQVDTSALNKRLAVVKYLFLERNALMPFDEMFKYLELMKEKVGRETAAQSVFDYVLQNKSRYKTKDIQEFKKEFLEFQMSEEDSKNLKPIVKFL